MSGEDVGTVVVLNGPWSSGKSTLARELQDRWDGPLLEAGLGRHLAMLPRRYLSSRWPEIYVYSYAADGSIASISVGPVGERLHRAMHRSVARLGRGGFDVVVDHVLLDGRWAGDLAEALSQVPAVFVGVRCPLEVLEARERERADRTLGQAAAQHAIVHGHGRYDVEVDTSCLDPAAAADVVLAWLTDRPTRSALEELRTR